MKYIMSVTLTGPPMPCAKLTISFANDFVHNFQIIFWECLVRCWCYIHPYVSSYMITSKYPRRDSLFCFIHFYYHLKEIDAPFSNSVSTWCFGAACVANSAPIAFVLQVRDLVLLCCGETVSGMNIRGVGRFLGVIGIGLVVGSNLGYGVGFAVELASWFLSHAVM